MSSPWPSCRLYSLVPMAAKRSRHPRTSAGSPPAIIDSSPELARSVPASHLRVQRLPAAEAAASARRRRANDRIVLMQITMWPRGALFTMPALAGDDRFRPARSPPPEGGGGGRSCRLSSSSTFFCLLRRTVSAGRAGREAAIRCSWRCAAPGVGIRMRCRWRPDGGARKGGAREGDEVHRLGRPMFPETDEDDEGEGRGGEGRYVIQCQLVVVSLCGGDARSLRGGVGVLRRVRWPRSPTHFPLLGAARRQTVWSGARCAGRRRRMGRVSSV